MARRTRTLPPHATPSPARRAAVGLAAVTILSVTFMLGWVVGRERASSPPSEVRTDRRPTLPDDGQNGTRPIERTPDIQEKLTFYRTLTAPLASWSSSSAPGASALPAAHASPQVPGFDRASSDGRSPAWTIQVAAFGVRDAATALGHSLGTAGFDAYVSQATGQDGRVLYRVRIGSYSSREAAEKVAQQLRSERALDPFVARR